MKDIPNSNVFPWEKLVRAESTEAKLRGGVVGMGDPTSNGAEGSMQASGNLPLDSDPGTNHGHE